MNRMAAALLEQAGDYAHLLDRVSAGLGSDVSSATPIRLSSDRELLAGIEAAARLIRLAQGELVQLAGEAHRRSAFGDEESLAKAMGEKSPTMLIARQGLLSSSEAAQLVLLGAQARPNEALSGQTLPPDRPHLAAALEAGAIPLSLAAAFRRLLDRLARTVSRDRLAELEAWLVALTGEGWTVDEVLADLHKVIERLDPDGTGGRDQARIDAAKVTRRTLESGIVRYILDLDPTTAGLFRTAMDAGATLRRPATLLQDHDEGEDDAGDEPDGVPSDPDAPAGAVSESDARAEQADRRPLTQRRVDGVRLMATRALRMDDGDTGGTAVTIVVTVTEESFRTGMGTAVIDGIDTPIPAGTARTLAAGADLMRVVLDGDGQVIDYGPVRRLFSQGQRRAMGARDRGCVGPGCQAPLSACEGAHIRPHGYGNTSIDNGVMLCWSCHRLLDLHGWQIRRTSSRWWWYPPPWIDPYNRPRPGGHIPPPDLTPEPFGN